MAEKKVRIDADTNKDLMLLTIEEDEKSMGKMIRKLIEFYKESRVQNELPVIETKEEVDNEN